MHFAVYGGVFTLRPNHLNFFFHPASIISRCVHIETNAAGVKQTNKAKNIGIA